MRHVASKLLFPLLGFVFFASSAYATQPSPVKIHSAIRPVPRFDNPTWKKRYEENLRQAKHSKADVLFLGDSITEGWLYSSAWKKHFAKRSFNAGFSGDKTQHVLYRLQNGLLDNLKPKLVVLMIGTNNTLANSPQQIAEGIKMIIDEVHQRSPNSRVLLHAILPSGKKPDAERRLENNEVNRIIRGMAQIPGVHYKDFNHIFLEKDGSISKKTMPDYLHLSGKSYHRWANAMKPAIETLLRKI